MTLSAPLPLALGRFRRLPQRTTDVWQGGLVRLPFWIDHPTDPAGPPWRPTGALWVSVRTGLVHLAMPDQAQAASPELALRALVEFGLQKAKALDGRPGRVEVRDAALAAALAEPLAALHTSVAVVEDLPVVREVLAHMEADMAGGPRVPGCLDAEGVTVERLRAFADAAAAFYAARPWVHLANEDLIVVEDLVPASLRHMCVLGRGGEQFGLAFFDSRRAFERVLDAGGAPGRVKRAHGITYGTIDELPFADADVWIDHGLPVAGPLAYPLAADLHLGRPARRPDARELAGIEALLRAVAATTEDELDPGRWQKRVETFDGPVALTLTLPALLEAEAGHSPMTPPHRMPRVAERGVAQITRFLETREFGSLDDMNAALRDASQQGLFETPPAAAAGRELTALERAQELAYDAMEVEGRLRITRARQALQLSPDCADAWVLLAESAPSPEVALERYEQAVAAGRRALGEERFASLEGEFWGHVETRPYMRARLGLAGVLRALDREEDALEHYRALLRLNPGDNQGVRYLLLIALLELGRDEDAGALLDEHNDDIQALWPWARVVWQFRREGESGRTEAAFEDAVAANAHVLGYLLDPDAIPSGRPPSFTLRSREEAAYVAESLEVAVERTPGLDAWLRARRARAKRRARTPSRRRRP